MKTLYFEVQHAVDTHDAIIDKTGGAKGLLDIGKVESVLEHIRNDTYYGTFLDKLTHLCFSLTKLHAFVDGNKRTTIALGAFFLLLNGYTHCIDQFIQEMKDVVLLVASNVVDRQLLNDVLYDIIMQERREEISLKLIHAMEQYNAML